MTSPSLADDEATLANYAHVLADAIDQALPAWFQRSLTRYVPHADETYADDIARASAETSSAVRSLLALDIADQTVAPLEILRRAVRFSTSILAGENVAHTNRDDFAKRAFPDDVYDLSPASFADVDQALHEPGLVWGAAKAHVHLRRRREAVDPAEPAQHVIVLCTDLMDRSKIAAALPHASFVRKVAALREAATPATVALVDLRCIDQPTDLGDLAGTVIAFGSHVDEEALDRARAAGAQALPRSIFFKRLATGDAI